MRCRAMVQEICGSAPRSIAHPGFHFHSDWSPTGKEIAFVTEERGVETRITEGEVTFSIPPLRTVFDSLSDWRRKVPDLQTAAQRSY
jgi:hypothetical protein